LRLKPYFLPAGAILLLIVLGCSGGPDTLEPSSTYPTLGKSRPIRYSISSLVVFTDRWIDLNLGSGDDGSVRRPTGYTLYDDHGERIQFVRNYIGAMDSEPTVLELNPGKYLILLEKPGKHPPLFWVVVEPGKLTEVDILH
jgi:hypothetical protein